MSKATTLKRIQDLSTLVNESAANYQNIRATLETATNNHHLLLGRLEEAKELYQVLENSEESIPSNSKAEKKKG